jgi:hypothetical protein
MNPDPSIRTRLGAFEAAVMAGSGATLVSGAVARSFVQDIEAGAIGTDDILALDMQEHPRVPEGRIGAAIAGDCAVVDVDDFGRGGAVGHFYPLLVRWTGG